MRRLYLVFALIASAPAQAQEVPPQAALDLWCGTAFAMLAAGTPDDSGPDKRALAKGYADAGDRLIQRALPLYLESGYTDRALSNLRNDLAEEIGRIIHGPARMGERPAHSFEDCSVLLLAKEQP